MAGTRTSIQDQLQNTKVGTELDPGKQTVQPHLSSRSLPQSSESSQVTDSRQGDENTNSLPGGSSGGRLAPISVFVPPASADPAERLAHCTGAIREADQQTELATERITQQYLLWVGEPYRIVRDEELFRLAGHDTFDAWGRALNGHGSDYMNKVIRVGPVVRALAPVTRRQLREGTLRPLVSVQRDHGDDAARACWAAAEAAGDLTEHGLLAAAVAHGYKVNLEAANGRTPAEPSPLKPSSVLGKIQRLAATDPERALELCRTLRADLTRLENDLVHQSENGAAEKG